MVEFPFGQVYLTVDLKKENSKKNRINFAEN